MVSTFLNTSTKSSHLLTIPCTFEEGSYSIKKKTTKTNNNNTSGVDYTFMNV